MIFGAERHLKRLPPLNATIQPWPVPFADGIPLLLAERGRSTVMLVSGDPFWFGAGNTLARHLGPAEWRVLPAPSTFSLAAARLGWPLEQTVCLGLHAAPLTRLRPYLRPGQRLLVLVRDGEAVAELASRLSDWGFPSSSLHVLEALGGDRERIRRAGAADGVFDDIEHPVAVAVEPAGPGPALPCTAGIDDAFFEHDGQLTKQTVRAATLAALAPRGGERLWDIGTGCGSIAIEWLLAHPANRAVGFDRQPERAARARQNARNLGVDWLEVVEGETPSILADQPAPDAVFIGGGLSTELLDALWKRLEPGTRLVANAVTLESQSLLSQWQAEQGGSLMRLETAGTRPMGRYRAWQAAYPVVQWRINL